MYLSTLAVFKDYFRIMIYFLHFAIFLIMFSAIDTSAGMTRDVAKQIVIERVITGDPNEDNLIAFGPQNMLVAGDIVSPFIVGGQPFPGVLRTIDKDTWFFWLNDETNDLFAHKTRFVYIDANHTDPTIGDGIIIDEAGWWPTINGNDYYRRCSDRTVQSQDWVYGQLPEEPQEADSSALVSERAFYFSNLLTSSITYAIIISGESDSVFAKSMNNFKLAMQNSVTGPGIPTNNLIIESNCSYNHFINHIHTANSSNADTLYIFVSAHGHKEGIVLNNTWCSSDDIASAISQSTASNIYVVTESCYDGTLVDEIQQTGVVKTIVTATDGEHPAMGRGYWVLSSGGSFSKELCEHWQDGTSKITLEEAYQRVITANCAWWDIWCIDAQGQGPTLSRSVQSSVPTLSEWKQIFLTLLILSLVMGVIPTRLRAFSLYSVNTVHTAHGMYVVLNRQIFYLLLKWIGLATVLGLAGATVVFGRVSIPDMIGTVFCAPLAAYILHLVILFIRDHEGVSE